MPSLLLVMLGGALGAGGRHLVGRTALAVAGPGYPWGTLTANVVGGLLMGLLAGSLVRFGGSESTRLFLGVGLLGGFTTFSAFSLEVVLMAERGALIAALLYALVSVAGAVVALLAGLSLTRVLA